MSPHERMMAAYRGQASDMPPLSIYKRYLPTAEAERLSRNLGLGISDYLPPVTLLAPPWHIKPGYVSPVRGVDLHVRYGEEDGQPVETRRYETPVGAVWQESIKDPHYGSDWIRKHYIASPDDYRVMQYIVEHTRFQRNEAALRRRVDELGGDGVVLGRLDRSPFQKLLMELAGPERFLEDYCTQRELVTPLLEAMAQRMDEAFEMVLESSAEVIWQPDNISGDMTPPDAFAAWCVPFYQSRGRRLRDAGKPYVIHMDGRLGALRDLIAACEFDVVESFSLPMLGNDMTLGDAWAAWPDKGVFPNFPSPLCLEDEASIRAFVDRLLEEVGGGRPFMLQVSEDIPADQWQRVLPILCRAMNGRVASGSRA